MTRYLPIALAAVAITGAMIFNGLTTNRWSGGINAKAKACALYLPLVPKEIGPWVGSQNNEVDQKIRDVAGIVGEPISRRYTHRDTGDSVELWLIVGHSSQIIRHTPNVCYPSAGFRPEERDHHYEFKVEGQPKAQAWTNRFLKQSIDGRSQVRVFWMWHRPEPGRPVEWEAPGHKVSDARDAFAGAKALFKMYLTAPAGDKDESAAESVANKFAADLLPVLNEILAEAAEGKPPAQAAATPAGDAAPEETEAA